MRFGLDDSVIEKLEKVFEANPRVDKAYIFGSRAKGNFRKDSDIDIAIKGFNLTLDDVLKMSVAFEDEGITNKIDLLDYDEIKEPALREHIDRVRVEFYSRWKEYKLGDFIEVINGFAFKSADFLETSIENSLPIIKIKNVANGDVHLKDVQFHKYSDKLSKYLAEKGDILISLTGNHPELETQVVGLVSKYKFEIKSLINQRVAKIIVLDDTKLVHDYAYYFLKDNDTHNYLASQSSGSANQANISKVDVQNIPIIIPPIPEQEAVVSTLKSLDDKIDLLNRQNKTLEQLAETLFRQWFVEEAEDDWEEARLYEHTEVLRGLSYKGSGLTDEHKGVPMHNLNSVYEGGGYKYDGIKFYKGDFKERHKVTAGDIIVTNTEQGHELRLIGFPAIVPDYYGIEGIFSQHVYKITPLDKTYLSRGFIYYLLMSPSVREQIVGATNGSTVNMLAIDGLQQPKFQLPPKEKVDAFTLIAEDYRAKQNINQNQIRSLTKMRDTLLPKLMSGEVRVKM